MMKLTWIYSFWSFGIATINLMLISLQPINGYEPKIILQSAKMPTKIKFM